MNIHDFMKLPHRFRWGGVGGDDCMTFPATWAERSIGIDPAADLRGTYRTKDEAHEIMDRFGGQLAFMEHHLSGIGAKPVQHPETGDIGLIDIVISNEISITGEIARVGAVRFGPTWACLSPRGVIAKSAAHIAAWRLPA